MRTAELSRGRVPLPGQAVRGAGVGRTGGVLRRCVVVPPRARLPDPRQTSLHDGDHAPVLLVHGVMEQLHPPALVLGLRAGEGRRRRRMLLPRADGQRFKLDGVRSTTALAPQDEDCIQLDILLSEAILLALVEPPVSCSVSDVRRRRD